MMIGNPLAISIVATWRTNSQSVHDGHVDIAQDKIYRMVAECSQSFGSVAGLEDFFEFDASLSQGTLDDLTHHGGVVHDQRPDFAHTLVPSAGLSGGFTGGEGLARRRELLKCVREKSVAPFGYAHGGLSGPDFRETMA
jgi:hypothetical protein